MTQVHKSQRCNDEELSVTRWPVPTNSDPNTLSSHVNIPPSYLATTTVPQHSPYEAFEHQSHDAWGDGHQASSLWMQSNADEPSAGIHTSFGDICDFMAFNFPLQDPHNSTLNSTLYHPPVLAIEGLMTQRESGQEIEKQQSLTTPPLDPIKTPLTICEEQTTCSLGCEETFSRAADFRRHMSKHETPTYKCFVFICDRTFYRYDKLRDHAKRGHKKNLPSQWP
jgi:hypothetical protein